MGFQVSRGLWMGLCVVALSGCTGGNVWDALRPKSEPTTQPTPVVAAPSDTVDADEDVVQEVVEDIEEAVEEIEEPTPEPEPEPEPEKPEPAGEKTLGTVVVALGSPTDPGKWIKTSLVSSDTPGRVVTQTGVTLALTLRPLGQGADGGAQISLAALQELGLPITGLAEVTLVATP